METAVERPAAKARPAPSPRSRPASISGAAKLFTACRRSWIIAPVPTCLAGSVLRRGPLGPDMLLIPHKMVHHKTIRGDTMKRLALAAALLLSATAAQAQLASRITHYDVTKTANLKAVHDGAGTMNFGPLMTDKTLSTNFIFLHRGVLHPHGGIGQHFHNHCEEMFVIFDDEAEFTINGRTSLLKGTVGAPDRMGSR